MAAGRFLVATIAVGGLLAAGAVWWWSERPKLVVESDPPAGSRATGAEVTAPDASSSGPSLPTTTTADPVRELSPGSEPIGPEVQGSIVLVDERGSEHRELDGWFEWRPVTDPPVAESSRVEIRSGRFAVRLAIHGAIEIGDLVLDARAAAASPTRVQVASAEPLALTAKWLPATQTNVLDRERGLHLEDVKLLEILDASPGVDPRHPGDRRLWTPFIEAIDSPFVLPALVTADAVIRQKPVWIGAPGRAFDRFTLLLGDELPRWLELAPGADLTVTFRFSAEARERFARMSEASRHDELRLLVRKLDDGTDVDEHADGVRARLAETDGPVQCHGRLLVESAITAVDRVELPGLLPGAHLVTLERCGRAIAVGGVALERGESRTMELQIEADPRPTAPLAGTLFVPPAWNLDDFVLELLPPSGSDSRITRSEMERVAGKPGWFRWSAGSVKVGKCFLGLRAGAIGQELDVPPEGRTDVHLEVPPPVDLEVRLVDGLERKPLGPVLLVLKAVAPPRLAEPVLPRLLSTSIQVDAAGRGTWRTPSDRVEVVACFGSDARLDDPFACVFEPRLLELSAGPNVVEIAVERRPRIVFFLIEGARRLPWNQASVRLDLTVTPLTGTGGEIKFGEDRCFLPSAGRYRLEFDPPDSYEPIAPVEIEVPRGGTVEHDVRLISRT